MHHVAVSILLAIALTVPCGEASAQKVEPLSLEIVVPTGWTRLASTNPQFISLFSPDQKIRVTVYATKSDAIDEETLEQRAQLTNSKVLEAQSRIAKASGAVVVDQTSTTTRVGQAWHAETTTIWSNGFSTRGVTIFQRGRQLSVGSESRAATQSELAKAVQDVMAGVKQ